MARINYKHSHKSKPLKIHHRKQKINPMNTKTNRQLLLGHAILHAWAKDPSRTNWTKTMITQEHSRLVGIMKKRGIKHTSPLKFSDKWRKYS